MVQLPSKTKKAVNMWVQKKSKTKYLYARAAKKQKNKNKNKKESSKTTCRPYVRCRSNITGEI